MNKRTKTGSYSWKQDTNDCCSCGETFKDYQLTQIADELLCQDCLEESYFQCIDCEEWHDKDDTYTVYEEGVAYIVCEDCMHANYIMCEDCEQMHHRNDVLSTHDDRVICNDCFADNYFLCDDCEEIYQYRNCISISSTSYCIDCAGEHGNTCEGCGEWFYHDDLRMSDKQELLHCA